MLGRWGVGIFFLLSGLCIHLPVARRQVSGEAIVLRSGAYFRRRFRRIYPPHFVALVLSAIVAVILPWAATSAHLLSPATVRQFALHTLMLHTFSSSAYYSINVVLWTIALEAHFYLLYPLVVRIRPFLRLEWLAAILFLFSAVIRLLVIRGDGAGTAKLLLYNFPGRWWEWVLGAVLAEWLPLLETAATRVSRIWLSVAGTGLVALSAVVEEAVLRRSHGTHFAEIGMPFLFFLVLTVAIPTPTPRNRATRMLVSIGSQSYSLYLTHPIALTCVAAVGATFLQNAWLAFLGVLASYAVATAYFYTVERAFVSRTPTGPG